MPQVEPTSHQQDGWNNPPERLPGGFEATKLSGGRTIRATCEVWTSPFGWELRLMLDGAMPIASVVPSAAEMLVLVETWRAALLNKGWQ